MIKKTLDKLLDGKGLSFDEAVNTADLLMKGEVNNSQTAALLTLLKVKGETPTEIAGFATAMKNNGIKIKTDLSNTMDVCGTGGDNSDSFNISTAVAFVVAAAGIKVAKHGNRSITSKSGSSDVLSALGIKIDLTPEQSEKALKKIGISFLFAPIYHPAMKNVAPVRRELGFRTIFNMLGPLTNPAGTVKQIIGTFNNEASLKMAEAAKILGMEHVAFICTNNRYDEITLSHPTRIIELNKNELTDFEITAETFGSEKISLDKIAGGTPEENAKIIEEIFTSGNRDARMKVVAANAAMALFISGNSNSLNTAMQRAEEIILSGAAMKKLNELKYFSEEL